MGRYNEPQSQRNSPKSIKKLNMKSSERFKPGLAFAKNLDKNDDLKQFRDQFYFPEKDAIYLDGNSLGRLPNKTRGLLKNVVDHEWGKQLIRSWNEGWYELSEKVSGKIAQLVGADADEIATCDSTSMNLYKLAMAAMKSKKGRTRIVSDEFNFPTDLYVLQGIASQLGSEYKVELAKSTDSLTMTIDDLERVIDETTAVVVLSYVAFKSAFMYDMKAVTEFVHSKGALIIWDLSHAGGAVNVDLNDAGADMAIGCTYKYMNGGPGAPAYLYVAKHLQGKLTSPVWGWFGEDNPFAFDLNYKPASGIRRFLVGTPPVLSLSAIEPGLDLLLEAGMQNLRKKSIEQSEYLIYLWETYLDPINFELGSPNNSTQRGSHISLRHPEAYRICKALINPTEESPKIIPDFREPDNIRLGIAPIYNTYQEIYLAVKRMEEIVTQKLFESYSSEREAVT